MIECFKAALCQSRGGRAKKCTYCSMNKQDVEGVKKMEVEFTIQWQKMSLLFKDQK